MWRYHCILFWSYVIVLAERMVWINYFCTWCACLFMFNYDKPSCIFSCKLLTRNHMIFLVQFGINKHLLIFSKTTNCPHPMGLCNFVSLKKFTCAYLFQIALEIIWFPRQKSIPESQDWQNFDSWHAICNLHLCYMKNALVFSQSEAYNCFMYVIKYAIIWVIWNHNCCMTLYQSFMTWSSSTTWLNLF